MLKKYPPYPILFTLFPILSLTAYNIREIFIGEIWRPLVFSILLAVIAYGLFYLFVRNTDYAALISSVVLSLFFSYGQIYSSFEGRTVFAPSP